MKRNALGKVDLVSAPLWRGDLNGANALIAMGGRCKPVQEGALHGHVARAERGSTCGCLTLAESKSASLCWKQVAGRQCEESRGATASYCRVKQKGLIACVPLLLQLTAQT